MSKKDPRVLELRRVLKNRVDFPIWVRAIDDKVVWVGAEYASLRRMELICAELTKLGYSFECNGKPGTEGEDIIDVLYPKGRDLND